MLVFEILSTIETGDWKGSPIGKKKGMLIALSPNQKVAAPALPLIGLLVRTILQAHILQQSCQ
jgi:hypothetical protein